MGQLLIHLKRVLSINLRLMASRPTYLVAHRRASIGHTGNGRLSDELKGRPANTTELSVFPLNFSGRAVPTPERLHSGLAGINDLDAFLVSKACIEFLGILHSRKFCTHSSASAHTA